MRHLMRDNFMPYITRTNEDLKVGMHIRLAGRKGKIMGYLGCKGVSWNDEPNVFHGYFFSALGRFPLLEIWIDEPTISQEAADEIIKKLEKCFYSGVETFEPLKEKILSMVEGK